MFSIPTRSKKKAHLYYTFLLTMETFSLKYQIMDDLIFDAIGVIA